MSVGVWKCQLDFRNDLSFQEQSHPNTGCYIGCPFKTSPRISCELGSTHDSQLTNQLWIAVCFRGLCVLPEYYYCTTVHISTYQYISVHISTYQYISVHISTYQCISVHISAYQCISVYISVCIDL